MKMSEIIEELILKKALYEKVEIECDELKWETEIYGVNPDNPDEYDYGTLFEVVNIPYQIEELLDFIMKQSEIYGYCPHCEKGNVLILEQNRIVGNLYNPFREIPSLITYKDDFEGFPKVDGFLKNLKNRVEVDIYKEFKNGIFIKHIKCRNCNELSEIIVKFEIQIDFENNKSKIFLQKIGQYPQLYKWKKDKKNFYKILDQIKAKEDYIYAIKSAEDGYYIGAYTYLRRVLEKYLLKKYQKAIHEKDNKLVSITQEKFEEKSYSEKKDLLKDYLIQECIDHGQLFYSKISNGIHSLNEEYCKNNYETFINAIDIILEAEEIKRKKESLKNKTIKELNKIDREKNIK